MKLPPKPSRGISVGYSKPTDAEWIAWGRACAKAALEEAAKECEMTPDIRSNSTFEGVAAAIRSIKIEEE